jgi:hypothetical protein
MATIQGGKVCINVDVVRTPFFKTYQGLRQGDPLPPFMFNLVAEVLTTLMKRSSRQGKVRGVMTHLIPEGITHIQYADDTISMVEGDDESTVNMKFIHYCFEWMSCLKIKYHKSKAYFFGMDELDSRRIANMLNCTMGSLPMKYLGIPLTDMKLGMGAFDGVVEKIAKRVPPWKGKHMSSGARLILSNSCLTSLPMYTMEFYLLPGECHKKMNSIRCKFFWRGVEDKFKYHMVKWVAIYRPRKFGGLGIINTQIINECMMVKWTWKIYQQSDSLWARILRAKYMRHGDFFRCTGAGRFQF